MSIERETEEARLAEIQAILQGRHSAPEEDRGAEIMAILQGASRTPVAEQRHLEPPAKQEFSWPRFLGEHLAKGPLALADLIQILSQQSPMAGMASNYSAPALQTVGNLPHTPVSENMYQGLRNAGLDLRSQGEGTTIPQRIAGKAAEFAGASLIPGGGLAGLAKSAATGAGMGALAGGLHEAGVPEPLADIAGVVAPLGAIGLARHARRIPERRVAHTLREITGEQNIPGVLDRLKHPEAYENIPGYAPMTAEIANNPGLAQIHRAQMGKPGFGMSDAAERQHEAIMNAVEPQTFNKSTANEIKDAVAQARADLIKKRHQETHAGFEAVEQMNDELQPKHLLDYLGSKRVTGLVKKDFEDVRRYIEPAKKPTKTELDYKKLYDSMGEAAQKQMMPPVGINPSVADLKAALEAINVKIDSLYVPGQTSQRVHLLRKAKDALEKDLEKIPSYKEVRAQYKDLSQPIKLIEENPVVGGFPTKDYNEVMPELFNKSSGRNFHVLKKTLGENPEQWEGVQHSVTDYLLNQIQNKGARATGNKLSYAKMDNFLKKHKGALRSIYDKDQMKLIENVYKALEAQNKAHTLGIGTGSDTQTKLAIDALLSKGMGIKALESINAYLPLGAVPLVGKPTKTAISMLLEGMGRHDEKKLVDVLNKALLEPDFAYKLLHSRHPKDFINLPQAAPLAVPLTAREQEQ
jgi:hypothetical protein